MTEARTSENGITRVPIHRTPIEEALAYRGRIPLREGLHDEALAARPRLQDPAHEWDGRGEDLWSVCHLEVVIEPSGFVVCLVADAGWAEAVLAASGRP